MNDRCTENVVCENKVMNVKRVAEAIKALVNEKRVNLKRARVC